MGMTFSVSLVPWNGFLSYLDEPDPEARRWFETFDAEETEFDSVNGQFDFMHKLDVLSRNWRSPAAIRVFRLFDSLFCGVLSADSRILDVNVPKGAIPKWIGAAWSPATVRRFAELWRGVTLEPARRYYKESPVDDCWCATFDEFKSWAEEYGNMVLKGADQGLGLVTSAF